MEEIVYYSDEPQEHLIDILAKLRRYQGITQECLAEILDTSKSNISRFEHGIHSPTLRTLANHIDAIGYEFKIVLVEK